MLFIIFIILNSICFSQTPQQRRLVLSKAEKDLYEVNEIRFLGNKFLTEEQLLPILDTKPTDRSMPHKVLQYYLDEVTRNTASPPKLKTSLAWSVKGMWNEIRYYDRLKAEEDIKRIKQFYYQFGFHKTSVKFVFQANETFTENFLTFFIDEGERWKISAIDYNGLDSLAPELTQMVNSLKKSRVDSGYNERMISEEVKQIKSLLLNNGYYDAFYDEPVVTVDTLAITDSIHIEFHTGKRKKISDIVFVDSTKGQIRVVDQMKLEQMDLKRGDWYAQKNHESSYSNMLSLGTFDMVIIDTIANKKSDYDSTIAFRVFSQYRKQQEYGFGFYTNQTVTNSSVNAGIELSYFHRNIFGAAQVINPFARVGVLDISRAISNYKDLELEYQLGLNYTQAIAWSYDVAKIGFSTQILLSQRTVLNKLKIFTFSIPIKFPVKLPSWTYFNHMSADFSFERQVVNGNISDQNSTNDTTTIYNPASIYSNLATFLGTKKPWLTANLIGFSFIGDSRDNPFTPKSGKYSFLSIDAIDPLFSYIEKIGGMARYAKVQLTNFWFWSIDEQIVLALKQREGYIYWFDKDKSYVPFERHFFAGGANSVRGWPSRQLRFNGFSPAKSADNMNETIAKDYVGSAGLIEGSIEMRYSFGRPTYVGGLVAEVISSMGVTGFVDWGNAYQWLRVDTTGTYSYNLTISEIFQGIAVSAGLGLRYDTPVGPFRLDLAWPVYDPYKESKPFSHLQINIGLGHAF